MNSRYQHYLALRAEHPQKYARDLAGLMQISEAELTAARLGHDAIQLRPEFSTLLAGLEPVGETKNITRNTWAVHEQLGVYSNLRLGEHTGLVLNPRALDLRLFPGQWQSVFALREQTPRGERQSIQIFDYQGDAVLKIYATENTQMAAWADLINALQCEPLPLTLRPAPVSEYACDIDADALEQDWRAMTDVHQFFGLLKKYRLSRQQAFRAVSSDLACQVSNDALRRLLQQARQDGNEMMVFVGNRGCVQIFTGVIDKVVMMDNWLNIFNPAFTLHLQETEIAETWISRKPTKDGIVTSLEVFAADGTQIAQLYGQRTEGMAEQSCWRLQVAALFTPGDTE